MVVAQNSNPDLTIKFNRQANTKKCSGVAEKAILPRCTVAAPIGRYDYYYYYYNSGIL